MTMDTVIHNRMILHLASQQGRTDVVEQLLVAGAEINAKDSAGLTALHYAVRAGHEQVALHLINRGADVNARARLGSNATPCRGRMWGWLLCVGSPQ